MRLNQEQARLYLDRIRSHLDEGVEAHLLVSEDVAGTLQAFVEQNQIDLVVLSAHGYTGNPHWPLGSVTTNFLLSGGTPLLIGQDFWSTQILPLLAERAAQVAQCPPPARQHVFQDAA